MFDLMLATYSTHVLLFVQIVLSKHYKPVFSFFPFMASLKENNELSKQRNKNMFLLFGFLQMLLIGATIFLIFHSLNTINGSPVIGLDSQILLSALTPLTTFSVEYAIYSKK